MPKYQTYELIRKICKEQGRTIRSLEEEAGLKPDSVKRWADSKPIANSLLAVAEVLGVPAEQLLLEADDETS